MSSASVKIERPKSVSKLVLDQLRREIVEGSFKLGERLSEAMLAERYSVTKAPIRSAYIRLESEGLVEIRPQSGTYVFKPDHAELRALCELRIALEIEAGRMAFERDLAGTTAAISDIVASMERAQSEGAFETYQKLDTELHIMIVSRAQSPLLAETYRVQVSSRFEALRFRFAQQSSHADASMAEHRALRDAIVENDAPAFLRLLREHVGKTQNYYADFVE